MELHALILQQAAEAPPGGTEGEAQPGGGGFLFQMLPFVVIFILFYFLLIRPQKRQQKDREALLSQIKKNDHVATSGGILGIVDKVKDSEVVLKIDDKSDVRIRVRRAAIVDIVKVSGGDGEPEKTEAPEPSDKKQ